MGVRNGTSRVPYLVVEMGDRRAVRNGTSRVPYPVVERSYFRFLVV
jgi:hypothetical protein